MGTLNVNEFIRELTRDMAAEALGDRSDAQLIERALAGGCEAALEAVVRRHGPMVYRVCWRVLQQDQDAEDTFQATFLVLAQNLRKLRKHNSLASWLHGIARRLALKARAQAATRRRHEAEASLSRPVPPDEATWRELRLVLDAELEGLPEKWRLPLILCYLESRTQDEAAAALGWSKNTLRRRLEEAREALARRLARRGVGPAALSAVLLSDCGALAAPPRGLVAATVKAAVDVASGRSAVSAGPGAVALARGAGVATSLTRVHLAVALALTLASAAAVAGVWASSDRPEAPPPREKALPGPGEPGGEAGPDAATRALAGRYRLTLPSGFLHEALLKPLGGNRLALESADRLLVFSGEYELRDGKLDLVKPQNPIAGGYRWEVRGMNELALVAQPPVDKVGSDYLGATLTRLPDEKEPGAAKGPPAGAPAAARGDPLEIDGFPFKDAAEFRAYVQGADIVALGTLHDWDGTKGGLKVEKLYRGVGKPTYLSFSAGGKAAAKSGDKVLVLLKADRDGPKLHSVHASPGLFRNSNEVLSRVEEALKP
jgi:RNA polymerase sigma factor (sigma-70 family)